MTIWIYLVVSGCQLVCPLLLIKLVFGNWDAMVHATEIRTTELCYVLSCFLMHSDNLHPPITASGELVSCWIGPVTSIIIGMDKGMSLDFICSGFETYCYFRL
jgi:hypothetical protein